MASGNFTGIVRVNAVPNPVKFNEVLFCNIDRVERLVDLRKALVGFKAFKNYALSTFCSRAGGTVRDTISVNTYFTAILGEEDINARKIFDVYVREQRTRGKVNENVTNFFTSPTSPGPDGRGIADPPKSDKLNSGFSPEDFSAIANKSEVVHAVDMTEQDWDVVARTTSLTNGFVITYGRHQVNGQNAIYQRGIEPFRFRPRRFMPSEQSEDPEQRIPEDDLPGLDLPPNVTQFRIPRFRVDDQPDVEIMETKSAIEASLAASSFSSHDVESSASAGAFGFSATVRGGWAQENGESEVTTQEDEKSTLHIVYNFPRVTVTLNPQHLELTEECKDALNELKEKNTLRALRDFEDKFGWFFPTRLKLGGRLTSSDSSTATTDGQSSERTEQMKISASASISSAFVSASTSYGQEQRGESSQSSSTHAYARQISWNAVGGDTLLCNSPEEWAATVASFYNWRVLQQSDVKYLPNLIGQVGGYEWVPGLFLSLQMSHIDANRFINQAPFAIEVLHPNPEYRGYLGILSGEEYERMKPRIATSLDISIEQLPTNTLAITSKLRAASFTQGQPEISQGGLSANSTSFWYANNERLLLGGHLPNQRRFLYSGSRSDNPQVQVQFWPHNFDITISNGQEGFLRFYELGTSWSGERQMIISNSGLVGTGGSGSIPVRVWRFSDL